MATLKEELNRLSRRDWSDPLRGFIEIDQQLLDWLGNGVLPDIADGDRHIYQGIAEHLVARGEMNPAVLRAIDSG